MPKAIETEKRPRLPARAIFGSFLAAAVVAAGTALGLIGAQDIPQAEDFRFTRGTTLAPGEEMRLRGYLTDVAADARIGFRITGHTGTRGDAAANLDLSESRARAVQAIAEDMGIDPARLTWAGGVGGADPLPRPDGVTDREWERDLSRTTVEVFPLP